MEDTAVNLMPLIDQVTILLGSILTGFFSALAMKAMKMIGVDSDEKSIRRVREAIHNGVLYGREKLNVSIKDKVTVNIKSDLARMAAGYAMMQVGPVVKKLKWDEDYLERWAFSLIARQMPQQFELSQ